MTDNQMEIHPIRLPFSAKRIGEGEVREKWFTNEVFDSLDGVEDRLVEALAALEHDQELVVSTTGFDWIIKCSLTAT